MGAAALDRVPAWMNYGTLRPALRPALITSPSVRLKMRLLQLFVSLALLLCFGRLNPVRAQNADLTENSPCPPPSAPAHARVVRFFRSASGLTVQNVSLEKFKDEDIRALTDKTGSRACAHLRNLLRSYPAPRWNLSFFAVGPFYVVKVTKGPDEAAGIRMNEFENPMFFFDREFHLLNAFTD